MLRLRPSELTLTPEDVDETFRRITQGQISRAATAASSQASEQCGRPVIRRGPQRSTQDAITALGNIPILRPPQQQAVYTSVDDDTEDEREDQAQASPSNHVNNVTGPSSPPHNRQSGSAFTSASIALRSLHLPFRLGRDRRDSHTESTPDEQAAEAAPRLPAGAPEYAAPGPTSPASRSIRNNALESIFSTDSPTELRGGGRGSGRRRKRPDVIDPDASETTSAPQQSQEPSSPQRQESPTENIEPQDPLEDDRPTLYLEGYFKDPTVEPVGLEYAFMEMLPYQAQTEPHRRGSRQPMLRRSLSSGNAPTFAIPTQRPDPSGSSADDVFGTVPAPEPPTESSNALIIPSNDQNHGSYPSGMDNRWHNSLPQANQGSTRSRYFRSETSSTNAAFSYYGSDLPGSGESTSSEELGPPRSSQFQDNAGIASRRISDGAQAIGMRSNAPLPPPSSRGSSQSSPNLTSSVQHGVSPLPSMPYNRLQSVQNPPYPTPGSLSGNNTNTYYVDAATAAARGLHSPLDHYSRQYLAQQHAQQEAQRQALFPRQGMSAQPNSNPYQHNLQSDGITETRSRRGAASSYLGQVFDHQTGQWVIQPNLRHPSRQMPQSSLLPSPHFPTEQGRYPASQLPQSYGIRSHQTRNNHRPSENMPANPLSSEGRSVRQSQAQRGPYRPLRGTFSQGGPTHPTRSARRAQTSLPRDMANRPRSDATHSATIPVHGVYGLTTTGALHPNRPQHLQNPVGPQGRAPVVRTVSPRTQPTNDVDPGLAFRPRRANPQPSPPTTIHHSTLSPTATVYRPPAMRITSILAPTVAPPATREAPRGTRPPPQHVPPPRQHDQENSGEGEIELMRREERGINARHGDGEGGEVMDETPPRVGRVERRMFE